MTYNARKVLGDCQIALSLLEEEADVHRWRIHWAGAVALIRAVGHVLDKVDGRDMHIKGAASAAFSRWKSADPKHHIFREFIERERNNLLKEYHSDVHPLAEVGLVLELASQPAGDGEVEKSCQIAEIGENLFKPFLDGPWEGEDARDVLAEAIAWWDSELLVIEQEAAQRRAAGH